MVTNERYRWQTPLIADLLTTKPFLKIGEVAKLLGVKPHVLRYWESEFPSLRPKKNPSGQRIYAKADIEAIVEIKNLLYNQRYTISGAKRMLARQEEGVRVSAESLSEETFSQEIQYLKKYIQELLVLLQRAPEL
jgi:DNA-binding transcriptional MerR regulator